MMREIDRIPNHEYRSWWHSELEQHLSRHYWCRADREGYLGGLPEIEVCRVRGWDWNMHQQSRLLRHGSIVSSFRVVSVAFLDHGRCLNRQNS